jgi:site-specific DNA-methyltransferase (adenine-specific)
METMGRMENKFIDLIVTDPPYGMKFRSNHRAERYGSIHWDDNLDWVNDFCAEANRVLKGNSHLYMFCSFHNVDVFKQALERYFTVKNILIWEKNNTSMGDLKGDYAPKYEMILFATKGRRLLNGGRDPNIFKFARTGNKLHPTQKPVELISYLVTKSSEENEIIYDPFIGSGTTAEAAYDNKRNYIGSEIDETYYEISLTRIDRLERQGKLVV